MRRKTRHDSMKPIDAPTWLVVEDQYSKRIYVEELPAGTDPRMVMIRAMARSVGNGWEVEELPGTIPVYFCRRGDERSLLKIAKRDPNDQTVVHRDLRTGIREINVSELKPK
jgi:hypothetical protein